MAPTSTTSGLTHEDALSIFLFIVVVLTGVGLLTLLTKHAYKDLKRWEQRRHAKKIRMLALSNGADPTDGFTEQPLIAYIAVPPTAYPAFKPGKLYGK